MLRRLEAKDRGQEPIVAVVNEVMNLLHKDGLLPDNPLVVPVISPDPFWIPPKGVLVSHVTQVSYFIYDPRGMETAGEFGTKEQLADIEPYNGQLRPPRTAQFRHGNGRFSVWLNPNRVNPEVAARVRTGLAG